MSVYVIAARLLDAGDEPIRKSQYVTAKTSTYIRIPTLRRSRISAGP